MNDRLHLKVLRDSRVSPNKRLREMRLPPRIVVLHTHHGRKENKNVAKGEGSQTE